MAHIAFATTSIIPETLVQHEKAATFLDILKSFFLFDTGQSMKRQI